MTNPSITEMMTLMHIHIVHGMALSDEEHHKGDDSRANADEDAGKDEQGSHEDTDDNRYLNADADERDYDRVGC